MKPLPSLYFDKYTHLALVACVRCAGVYDYFVYLPETTKVLGLFENLWISESRRESHHKDEIPLYHSDIG